MTRAVLLAGLALVAVCASVVSAGIYPEDHWNYATQLKSEADYKSVVEKAVSGDHTLFVRWIASEG